MKSLRHYLTESVRTYRYTIKIAGDLDKSFLDMFKYNLNKFDPVKIEDPKTTPVQKDPYGFPELENESVTIIKAEFKYPATEPMIQQMAQLLGHNLNMVRVVDSKYDDSIDKEMEEYENQMKHSPVVGTTKGEDSTLDAKKASKDYSNSYLNSIKDQTKGDKITMNYSAKETKDAFDPFKPYLDDKKLGDKSPMTNISRPAKPKTGAKA